VKNNLAQSLLIRSILIFNVLRCKSSQSESSIWFLALLVLTVISLNGVVVEVFCAHVHPGSSVRVRLAVNLCLN
jgi:hypothetical protein